MNHSTLSPAPRAQTRLDIGLTVLRAVLGVIFIALNLLSDLLYKVFDPRTR